MKVQFEYNYPTKWGQNIYILGSVEEMGQWNEKNAVPLKYISENRWIVDINIKQDNILIKYKYLIKDTENNIQWIEFDNEREIFLSKKINETLVKDKSFQYNNKQQLWLKSAFSKVLFGRDTSKEKIKQNKNSITFNITALNIKENDIIGIVGAGDLLGNWGKDNVLYLTYSKLSKWQLSINTNKLPDILEYKYIIIDKNTDEIKIWETGDNRILQTKDLKQANISCIVNDNFFRRGNADIKRAGVSMPVFSIRTNNSFGVGDFSDIKKVIDWASSIGLSMIQVLPVNDTILTNTFLDSYPYNAISVFALHPLYINIFKVGILKDTKKMTYYKNIQKDINKNKYVDYPEIIKHKLEYLKLKFKEKQSVLNSKEFAIFFKKNRAWLEPYSTFCYLRDTKGYVDFKKWGDYQSKEIQELLQKDNKSYLNISFWYFVQFHLNKQLKEAYSYALNKKIVLKGDIPIGINRQSVDAWVNPHLYSFTGQAGAPPDVFSAEGQNWGFPTYNWDEMEKDNYMWWRQRLSYMSEFFDAYRIDHILGFFRIWEVPIDALQGVMGHFKPDLPLSEDALASIGFDKERMCNPYITLDVLNNKFGENKEKIIKEYLEDIGNSKFKLKKEYTTQKQIYNKIAGYSPINKLSIKESEILKGLLELVAEVLFLPVKNKKGYYYPRILMQNTHSFNNLTEDIKSKLNTIYDNYFYVRHETFWKKQALKKLPALVSATNMLVCGEDLGMIPTSVPEVMSRLGILSLEIQRMPKEYGVNFSDLRKIQYESILTTSTHDMSTIREWWEENQNITEYFYKELLNNSGEVPSKAEPWICKQIVTQHLNSPAMWTIFPIQDLLAMSEEFDLGDVKDERINDPSNPINYWRYRMPVKVEDIVKKIKFRNILKEMIVKSNRNN